MEEQIRDDGSYRKLKYGHRVIYKPNEWVFIHIPKNGGTSFAGEIKRNAFHYRQMGIHLLDISFNEIHNQASVLKERYKELRNCQTVAIGRNPWARCLSLFTFNCEAAVRPVNMGQDWSKFIHPKLLKDGFKKSWMPGGHFRDHIAMQNGITHNPKRTWRENDPQLKWLDKDAKVFKLETEMEEFYKFIGIPEVKTIMNKSKHYHYRLYYDDELRREIGSLYSNDINKFNSTF